MKLSEVMKDIYLSEGNVPIVLEVESKQWQIVFGHMYGNEFVRWCGVNGRVADIPAYCGDCEVIHTEPHGDGYRVFI